MMKVKNQEEKERINWNREKVRNLKKDESKVENKTRKIQKGRKRRKLKKTVNEKER